MKTIENIGELEFHHRQGGQFRWITVSTLLLAIGTILHLVSPSVAGVTPNWTIATYCVAICLTKPSYRQALGIGLVAALINVLTSKSGFPYGNLVSEPLGALTCAFIRPIFSLAFAQRFFGYVHERWSVCNDFKVRHELALGSISQRDASLSRHHRFA